jgi:hypothetical protein
MSKWLSDLKGDCPKRNAARPHERCDLICPDLPKVSYTGPITREGLVTLSTMSPVVLRRGQRDCGGWILNW